MYPTEIVAPMKAELTSNGFSEMTTKEEVDTVMAEKEGTTLVVVNSVCGCAAGNCRPGAVMSLENDKLPTRLKTVFAGYDKEATEEARNFMLPYPPSSPSIALFKDGRLVHMLERHHIENATADMISDNLKAAYNDFC
jgi:putative YphP/YqiW family bacilliredoxin